MEDKTYNGWTNYETWNVNLWIDNEQGSYDYWREAARECWQDAADEGKRNKYFKQSREEFATFKLADRLKDEIANQSQDMLENAKAQASMWADLLGAALSDVNYHEIAEHWISEAAEANKETA